MHVSSFLALAPATERYLGIPGGVLHGLLLLGFLALFASILARRVAPLLLAAPDPRLDRPLARLGRLLVVGVGQSRQPRYPLAGWLHIVIFVGFLVLLLRSLTLLGEGFSPGFSLPGLDGRAGRLYAGAKDWVALLVLGAVAIALLRRAAFHPARYRDRTRLRPHGAEAYVILSLIALLLLADAVYEGAARSRAGVEASAAEPLASAAAGLLGGAPAATLDALHLGAFWVHDVLLLVFLCYLPVSKHFHVITALPNVFLSKLPPSGRVKPPRHGVEDLDRLERLGTGRLEDQTWKQLLDAYSCTDCGRCSDQCPAYATGTPLSPRMLTVKTRDAAYAAWPVFGPSVPESLRPPYLGETIREAEVWACTTCGACEDVCPVTIEYVDRIVDLRRRLVEEGRVPPTLVKALAEVGKKGNPYGKMARARGDWVKDDGAGVAVRRLQPGEACQDLLFTDSGLAYDPRLQRIARAFARLLAAAGRDVGTLGKDEQDSGHEARRMGEEGLFESLRDHNREALAARSFERIVSPDPHAVNALRNDYRLERPVRHHTEVLAELVASGAIRPSPLAGGKTYVFHDPCYLGRHLKIYDAPRRALAAIPGLRLVEMERSQSRSFCCGGGSLYLFLEGQGDRRMAEVRAAMAEEAGATVIVTACPFCLVNLEDAVKTTGRAGRMEVLDIAEVLAQAAAPPAA